MHAYLREHKKVSCTHVCVHTTKLPVNACLDAQPGKLSCVSTRSCRCSPQVSSSHMSTTSATNQPQREYCATQKHKVSSARASLELFPNPSCLKMCTRFGAHSPTGHPCTRSFSLHPPSSYSQGIIFHPKTSSLICASRCGTPCNTAYQSAARSRQSYCQCIFLCGLPTGFCMSRKARHCGNDGSNTRRLRCQHVSEWVNGRLMPVPRLRPRMDGQGRACVCVCAPTKHDTGRSRPRVGPDLGINAEDWGGGRGFVSSDFTFRIKKTNHCR